MGLLDQIAGALGQQSGAGGHDQLVQMAMQLINGQPGGLQGLIAKFAGAGLAEHAQSWVGTGTNLPISADQLQQVLGGGQLAALAEQFGLEPSTVSTGLAAVLPHVVDHLTPNGAVQDDLVQQGLSLLQGKLFG